MKPDNTLIPELLDLKTALLESNQREYVGRIRMIVTLIRESERRIVDSRSFSATETVGSDETQV